jgi:hypothetical protein
MLTRVGDLVVRYTTALLGDELFSLFLVGLVAMATVSSILFKKITA